MSVPMPWRKSGINTIAMVIFFCYKLMFKAKLRKVQILGKDEKYKLNDGKVYSLEYILEHQSPVTEHTPDLLIKFNNYIMKTLNEYHKIIHKAES